MAISDFIRLRKLGKQITENKKGLPNIGNPSLLFIPLSSPKISLHSKEVTNGKDRQQVH